MDPKISPGRDPPPNRILRRCTAAPHVLLASRYAPVENRGCVQRTSGPSASVEPAALPVGQSDPEQWECRACAFPRHPAFRFLPVSPVAVDRFHCAAVPRLLAHVASGTPEVPPPSSRRFPGSLYWP